MSLGTKICHRSKNLQTHYLREILTEAANTFISERKQIESQIEIFFIFIKQLCEKGRHINDKLSFLNYLLLDEEIIKEFYQFIGVDGQKFSLHEAKLDNDIVLEKMPMTFGMRKKYVNIVLRTYESLQIAINQYLSGDDAQSNIKENQKTTANYNMIMIMGNLINDNIKKINSKKSASSILQFAKSLNPELVEKEHLTGTISPEYESRINDKFRIDAIDMDNLPVEKYTELPKLADVKKRIVSFCNQIFKHHKNTISDLISNLNQ